MFVRLVFALVFACVFAACGDDSSSSVSPEPAGDSSSSAIPASSGDGSSSSQKNSNKDKSSSSIEKKSSSSVSGKNSSSSMTENPVVSSSSGYKACEKDEEGVTVYRSKEQIEYICNDGYWIPISSSSVEELSSSSKYYDMSKQFNANLSYGEFTDSRDNHVYKTIRLYDVVVGDTLTFFAENLNYGKMILGGEQQGDSTKYCYDDDPWYCENGFGGLYTWANAMNFPAVCDFARMGSEECPNKTDVPKITIVPNSFEYAIHQGICPDGWHIMNRGEWVAAIDGHVSLSGSEYLSSEVWMGVFKNKRGFSLLPAGVYEYGDAMFNAIMKLGCYWVPEEYPDDPAVLGKCAHFDDSSLSERAGMSKRNAASIRCVKDY